MVMDSLPKLTHSNWIKKQSKDTNINLIIQLLKSDKLKKFVARETDSSGVKSPFEISYGTIPKAQTTVLEGYIKKLSRTNFSVCVTKEFHS